MSRAIPPQLAAIHGARFVVISPREKGPCEPGWQQGRAIENPYLQKALTIGCNVGILGGYGHVVVVDCDSAEFAKYCLEKFPSGFSCTSGSAKNGRHLVFIVPDLPDDFQKRPLTFKDGTQAGDLIAWGAQCVIPPSRHPGGTDYRVVADLPIPKIKFKALFDVLHDYMGNQAPGQQPAPPAKRNDYGLTITDIISVAGFKKEGNDLRGAHPSHGSSTGNNFSVNLENNSWYCFRHNVGGGPLQLKAVVTGLCRCEEVNSR